LEPILLPIFLGRAAKGEKGYKKSPQEMLQQDITEITHILESTVVLFETNKICQNLNKDFFYQIFEYLDETIFNGLVQQRRLYSTDGVRLKVLSLNLEQWARESTHFGWLRERDFEFFKLVQEAANLLMVDKEKLVSESFLKATFKYIDPQHVVHFVEIFATDENSRKPAPAFVTKTLYVLLRNALPDKATTTLLRKSALLLHLPK